MTNKEIIGREALIPFGKKGVQVRVEITGVKSAYGRDLYKIEPVAGTGSMWIEKLTLIENK